ncbi:hypothetical protein [Micromonospora sp. WMMD812]|uniref:hypothetical protein n=1 Tax=Micromonospora sp. WMMD812 TaxID=3015152 RepID=UPI00248C1B98|nr:hypothetical protein [Micromonospora sp. WMMD812]WBB69481.1 hypothetical protein O7603_09070 [Micromonospora sp. WMMD812]
MPHLALLVVSLAVLVVLATLFLHTMLILLGLLTSITVTVRPLRDWLRRMVDPTPADGSTPVAVPATERWAA